MDRKIRILHIMSGADWAGGMTFARQILQGIGDRIFSFEFLCSEPGPMLDSIRNYGVQAHCFPMPLLVPSCTWKLSHLIKEGNFDLVQSHGARANFYSRLASAFAGIPHISTIHNSLYDYPVWPLRKSLYMTLDRWSTRYSTKIVCVAESHRREQLERYGLDPSKVVTIHNGVDLSRFDPQKVPKRKVRNSLGFGDEAVVTFLGRLTHQKDPLTFMQAFSKVKRVYPKAVALIVGDGDLRDLLVDRAKALGIQQDCYFLGYREDIPEILADTTLFVLSSVSEGLPYTILEALAMERPVIATKVNGVTEIIEHGQSGLLVPPKDVESLAHGILELLKNTSKAKQLAEEGRRRVVQEFSLESMLKNWERLYLSLLEI